MQLTERQCWKVIRTLVAEKNKEYASFLSRIFGERKLAMCIGFTKNAYLGKFGFSEEGDFRYLLKKRGIMPKREWLDNLSTEDLLLFLDFRCRSLQAIYDHYAKHNSITLNEVQQIINSTKRSDMIGYNSYRLKATGKPDKVAGEKKIDELDMDRVALVQTALIQAMGSIAYNYAKIESVDIDKSVGKAIKLATSNIDNAGYATGFKYLGDSSVVANYVGVKYPKLETQKPNQSTSKQDTITIIGFDEFKNPIFIKDGKQVNFMGSPVPDAKVVFDRDGKEIKEPTKPVHSEPSAQSVQNNAVEDNEFNTGKFIGLDIQGSPIYEVDGQYYDALGQRIDDDEFVEKIDDEFTI